MTLGDLTLPIPIETARGYALVFAPQLAERLAVLHAQYGTTNCVLVPRALTDGRMMLCADVLTEIGPGGMLQAMWEAADKTVLMEEVTVMPWEEAIALLPESAP